MRYFFKYTSIALTLLLVPQFGFAEEADSQQNGTGYHSDRLFVVETDEESAAESLNRVSGTIDLGFAAPEYTYQSKNHAPVDILKEREPD